MRRHLTSLAAVLLAFLSLPVPHALAAPHHIGDCRLVAIRDHTGTIAPPDQITGVVYVVMVVYDDDVTSNPAGATVDCILRINGDVEYVILHTTGRPVVVAIAPFAVTVTDGSYLELCTKVTYDSGPVEKTCKQLTSVDVPPQQVGDLVATAFGVADSLQKALVDPVLCPLLQTLAPGVPGLRIEADGDVALTSYGGRRTVLYVLLYDCPAYRGPTPPPPGSSPLVTVYYA
jgi:hypothetical protein